MNEFTYIFLVVLSVNVGLKWWLNIRHRRHVDAHSNSVPEVFSDSLSLKDHQKAASYTQAKSRFGLFNLFYDTLILLGLTVLGGLGWLDQLWAAPGANPVISGTWFLCSVTIVFFILNIPVSYFHHFVLEQKFGFNKSTLGTWITDMVKGLVLMAVLGIPLIWLILWIMQVSGSFWWLYVWLVLVSFSLFMIWAYPAFIAPLFNKFEPLADKELDQRITTLIEQCGFRSNGVFVMDGSKRSAHSNAFFTGIGNNKRIVFFDTLIKQLKPDEIEAVLAHELGHFHLKHIRKGMIEGMLMNLAGLAILGWLITQNWFFTGLVPGSSPSSHMALILFMLASPVFTFLLTPLLSYISRKREFEADDFAAEKRNPTDLVNALVKLSRENASTVTPDPLHSMIYDSHPPAMIRIANLNRKQTA